MGLAWRWLWLLVTLPCLASCAEGEPRSIERWTVSVEGGPQAVPIELPYHLDDLLPRHDTRYWLRTEVETGALRGQELGLVLPHLEGATVLRVDGEQAIPTREEPGARYRHTGPHVWRLPARTRDAEHLSLELEVEHRWTQSGWLDTVPRLGPTDRLDAAAMAVVLLNDLGAIAAACGLLLIGVMSLAVFLANRRTRRSFLWFGIQLLAASVYPLYVTGYPQLVLGVYDTVLLAVGLDVALLAAVLFGHSHFGPCDRRRDLPWVAAIGLAIALALAVPGPHWLTQVGARATVVVLAAVVAYQIVLGIGFVRRAERPRCAVVFLVQWIVLGTASAFDGLAWMGLGEPLGGVRAACLGLAAFALLNSLRLTDEHAHSLLTTDRLNHQLARRIAALELHRGEVERLNQQLRERMSHRSRQLFSLLSMVGGRTSPATMLRRDDLVGDKYRVLHELGSGGMGVVYAVRRQTDHQLLALKLAVHADAWGLARLAREAEIATRVAHPNVVAVTDVDIDPRGFLYLVMEHVDGPALSEYKRGFGRDRRWALDVLQQVAVGLAALHGEGVVHRDLKPANVLLLVRDDGGLQVKITDFGISRTLDTEASPESPRPGDSDVQMSVVRSEGLDEDSRHRLDAQLRGHAPDASGDELDAREDSEAPEDGPTRPLRDDELRSLGLLEPSSPLTEAGTIVGTPVYMAPELALEPPLVTPAADAFAFGVLAHQLLTGERPFTEPPVMEVAEGRTLPPELDLDLAQIPVPLRSLLRACLALQPHGRPAAARIAEVFAEVQNADAHDIPSRPFPLVEVCDLVTKSLDTPDPDAPPRRAHGGSPPGPHAAFPPGPRGTHLRTPSGTVGG